MILEIIELIIALVALVLALVALFRSSLHPPNPREDFIYIQNLNIHILDTPIPYQEFDNIIPDTPPPPYSREEAEGEEDSDIESCLTESTDLEFDCRCSEFPGLPDTVEELIDLYCHEEIDYTSEDSGFDLD